MQYAPYDFLIGELRGRCGALCGEAATEAIQLDATMERIRSLVSCLDRAPLAVAARVRLVPGGCDATAC